MSGTLYGIGLGPGDPELVTVKAMRLLQRADVVVVTFAKAGRKGHGAGLIAPWLHEKARHITLFYPVTTEIDVAQPDYNALMAAFYDDSAAQLSMLLTAGQDVIIASEGDPLFYGSFMHLFERLKGSHKTIIVPGVTGMAGCAAAAQLPMTWGDDVLTILPATLSEMQLTERLKVCDAAVIMKIGRHFAKLRHALQAAGLFERAVYVERGTMAEERILPLRDKIDDHAPYFAIVLVPGQGRRP